MYERHWQLTRSPFRSHDTPDFFCPLAGHQAALLKLRYALEHRQASAALIGPTGIGKSYLLRMLEAGLPATIGPMLTVNFPTLSPLELVRFLATELADQLGEPLAKSDGLDEWLHAWEKLLRRCQAANHLPVVVVDDAHVIEDRAIWQTWQLLLACRERSRLDFSVIFTGQPELLGRLQRSPQLEERLAITCSLTPLSIEETADYIAHRLQIAGRTEPIFADGALERIWDSSGGIPRRIDRLCDFSLLVGCADGLTQIAAAHIAAVSQELRGRAAA